MRLLKFFVELKFLAVLAYSAVVKQIPWMFEFEHFQNFHTLKYGDKFQPDEIWEVASKSLTTPEETKSFQ